MLHLVHFCDFCHDIIEDCNEERPIYFLDFPQTETFIFCSEDCRYEFYKEHCSEGYVYSNGKIERD